MAQQINVIRYKCEHCDQHFEEEGEAKYHEEVCALIAKFIKQGDVLLAKIPFGKASEIQSKALFCEPLQGLSSDEPEGTYFVLVEIVSVTIKNDNPEGVYEISLQYKVIPCRDIADEVINDHRLRMPRLILMGRLSCFLETDMYQGAVYTLYAGKALPPEDYDHITGVLTQIEKNSREALRRF